MNFSFLISSSILLLVCLSVDGKSFHSHACEGNKMKLFCHAGDVIKVIKADYGRSNASICEYFDDPNMMLDCHSQTATAIVKKRCDGKVRCKVEATNQLFKDPCPGQVKYLEAKYKCVTSSGPHKHHHTARVLNHEAASKKRDVNDQADVGDEVETTGIEDDIDDEPEMSSEYELMDDDDEEVKKPRKAINMHQILKYITNEKIDTSEGDIMF